jgi:type I restriction enzyme S subunit
MDNLNESMVARVKLPRPPGCEQKRILEFIEEECSTANRVIHGINQEIALLREFRTRLIADVVTGKLDVRETAVALPETAEERPEPIAVGEDLPEADDDAAEVEFADAAA